MYPHPLVYQISADSSLHKKEAELETDKMKTKTIESQIELRGKKYVVSVDNKEYYVVNSLSSDKAIQVVRAIVGDSRRNADIKAFQVFYSVGTNPNPSGNNRPGLPGKNGNGNGNGNPGSGNSRGRTNKHAQRRRALRIVQRPLYRGPIKKSILKKIPPQEAMALKENSKKKIKGRG